MIGVNVADNLAIGFGRHAAETDEDHLSDLFVEGFLGQRGREAKG